MIERVMMFIDGSNLLYGCKNYKLGYEIDLIKLREKLTGDRKLIRAYYYGSIPSKGDQKKITSQKKFYHFLEYNGFKVTTIPLRTRTQKFSCSSCNSEDVLEKQIEKGVDIALVTDMLSLGIRKTYDTAILVAGDLDYFKAIEELQRGGINLEIAYFRRGGISEELIRYADRFISLDDIAEEIKKGFVIRRQPVRLPV